MSKTDQPLNEGLDAVVCIPSICPLVSKSEIEAHAPGHHEHRKRITCVVDVAGMGRGYIHHRSVSTIGTKVSFRAHAIHEKAAALARW